MVVENQDNQGISNENEGKETPSFVVREVNEDDISDVSKENEEEISSEFEEKDVSGSENTTFESEDEYETIELNEEEAFRFLKESRGLDVESVDDLLNPKGGKKLSATAEKFQEFIDKTGNDNISDFLATQKDWSKEDPENVLKQLLKTENPTLDKEEIDFLFNEKYSYDEDSYDDADKTRKGINKKVDLQKALTFLEKQREEYMIQRGSLDNIPEDYLKAKQLVDNYNNEISKIEEESVVKRNKFVSTTESIFNDSFKGFETKIGEESFVVRPTDVSKTKEAQMDIRNFQAKFFDENENLVDPIGYHKALYFGMNADKIAEHYFNLGKASQAEIEEKESKNITETNGIRTVQKPTGSANFKVREV